MSVKIAIFNCRCRTLIGHFTGENPVELAENCANASEILTLLCYKIGLHQAIKELSPIVVKEINDIYPCEIKENIPHQMGDIGDAGVMAKMDGDGNYFGHLKSQEKERYLAITFVEQYNKCFLWNLQNHGE
jgi:hypothetical protein